MSATATGSRWIAAALIAAGCSARVNVEVLQSPAHPLPVSARQLSVSSEVGAEEGLAAWAVEGALDAFGEALDEAPGLAAMPRDAPCDSPRKGRVVLVSLAARASPEAPAEDEPASGGEARVGPAWATEVDQAWETRDCGGEVFDRSGPWTLRARVAAPDEVGAARAAGRDAGLAYARRVLPTWYRFRRTYYAAGHRDLRLARLSVEAGDWVEAAATWLRLLGDGSATVRGRALYNLAVEAEVGGKLLLAEQRAADAVPLLKDGRAEVYLAALRARREDLRRWSGRDVAEVE